MQCFLRVDYSVITEYACLPPRAHDASLFENSAEAIPELSVISLFVSLGTLVLALDLETFSFEVALVRYR